MSRFKLIFLLLITSFLLVSPFISIAQSPESFDLPTQLTLPGSSKYKLKRLKEKVTEFFKFSHKSKFSYRQILLEKRVSEFVSLVENKNQLDIANSSQRLAYQAGILADGVVKDSKENKELVLSLFAKYIPILDKMRDHFPANSPFWLYSQQDIDTLNILSRKLR